jgi:hypothetical protein
VEAQLGERRARQVRPGKGRRVFDGAQGRLQLIPDARDEVRRRWLERWGRGMVIGALLVGEQVGLGRRHGSGPGNST